jgi:hypothetical protein
VASTAVTVNDPTEGRIVKYDTHGAAIARIPSVQYLAGSHVVRNTRDVPPTVLT